MSNRGAKQSPFVGKRVPLVDNNGVPILYKRYTTVQELAAEAPASAPTAATDQGKPTKKEKGKSKHADLSPAPAVAEPPKKKQKREQQLKAVAHTSTSSDQEDAPAANSAAADSDADSIEARREARKREKKEKRRLRREQEAAEAAAAAAAAAARQRQEEEAQKKRRRQQESSKDSSSSDSEDDSEDDQPQPAPAAEPAPSSDSEESSSSDSEDESDRPAPAAKPANTSSSDVSSSDDSSDDSSEDEEAAQGAADQNGAGAPAANGGQAAAEASGSGAAGNAEEAGKIRSVMGFSQMSSKAAPSFKFGFSVEEQKAAEAEEKLKWIQMVDSVKDGYIPRRIYAGGMPFSWEEEQIREYWEFCGEVESIDMLRFPDTGRFRGLAFITFKTEAGFEAALQCDGEQCERGALKVMRCKPSMIRPSHRPTTTSMQQQGGSSQQRGGPRGGTDGRPQKVPGFNVAYVGNIAFETSLEELQELFQPYGSKFIRMHTDKATGKFKGYAHVHFDDEDGLDRCMELDGNRLHGREMRVSYAQPKKNAGGQS